MNETTEEQLENSKVPKQLQPYMYKKGQSGNPSGRPEGISMKEYIRMNFRKMTDEEREEFLEGMNKKDIFEMAEGKPTSDDTVTLITPNINIAEAIADKYAITPRSTE